MHPSAQKVADAARELGLAIEIVEHEQTTRSAEEAATAVGCSVGQIVKSLCFTIGDTAVIVLVSGANQLDTRKLAALAQVSHKQIKRPDPDTVKAATGFTIGGVPPLGHTNPLPIYIDQDLLIYDTVWAAAGTPFAVFAIAPDDLAAVTGGIVADLRR